MTADTPATHAGEGAGPRTRILVLSTIAFTLFFAVWLMLGMLGLPISKELNLSDTQLYYLVLTAILSGSLLRFHFGVWTDQYGGRKVFTLLLLATILPTYWVSRVTSYEELLVCAALFGIAGNSFTVGIAWNAAWFPKDRQGLALGIFGGGNVGASATKLAGPLLIAAVPASGFFDGAIPGGWRFIPIIYAGLLAIMAAVLWFGTPSEDRIPARGRSFRSMMTPLRHLRVWEFCLNYVVVFGAYVAISGVLPKYYYMQYGADLAASLGMSARTVADFGMVKNLKGEEYAAYLAANPEVAAELKTLTMWIGWLVGICFVFPASLLRPVGGWMSDRWGAKAVMFGVFVTMLASGALLSWPIGMGVWAFTLVLFVLASGMGIGKASVYKMIPDHFPRDVGAVGGLVGALGALGGVLLPIAWVTIPGSTFAALLALTAVSAIWFLAAERFVNRPAAEPVREPALAAAE